MKKENMTNLDRFTVMNVEEGKKYTIHNPETGEMEIVRCGRSLEGFYFTRANCPVDWVRKAEENYSAVYQHIRPAFGTPYAQYAVFKKEEFSKMFADKSYRIA